MTAIVDLTTEQGLGAYLSKRLIEYEDIVMLTGDGQKNIYKHAAPYLHSNNDFAFDPTRMDYESHALQTLAPLPVATLPKAKVHAVGWHSYDQEHKLLCIEDGGTRNLKTAYIDESLDIPQIGQDLGNWVASLHLSTVKTPLSLQDPHDLGSNNPVGVSIYRHTYNNLHIALAKYDYDVGLAKLINEEYGSKLATDNECICHGDLWPGNVLVKLDETGESHAELTVVDWEMVRRGTSATDVAQFAAEAFLLNRFHAKRPLLSNFFKAYFKAREGEGIPLGRGWAKRVLIHWAVHIAYWPIRVKWVGEEGTRKLVDLGVSMLKALLADDWDQVRTSELLQDIIPQWEAVLSRP
ncbi:hypothetical protein BU24DRAFT_425453 [Aaosphaeria arxii CBS 175.79]|uniref:Aminoglycoside phosphotransferase domain-containing protein n=1 Tax=Aaosphaeria arxii CBS 175.79 TaxID=1450172 RepID=A0A6A5XJ04_9PLEO|nr:uncharacterized protein BU24DRAFT_425453 [Aaosphaeria arxii CBS 175.79]KAF2012846.1 hypothetical protein BU24DRAFT_425453 [Aaosphaeria arxii CBS 175.79]